MIYEYECGKCMKIQEKHVKMGKKTKESCENCTAVAEHLKRIPSAHASMKFSWSKWSV